MASLFDDPIMLTRTREIINQIHEKIGAIVNKLTTGSREVADNAGRAAGSLKEQEAAAARLALAGERDAFFRVALTNKVIELERQVTEEKRLQAEATRKEAEAADAAARSWQNKIINFEHTEMFSKNGMLGKFLFGTTDQDPSALTGKLGGSIQAARGLLSTAQHAVFSGLPAGGLLGFFLMGANANLDDSLEMNKMAHRFRQLGVIGAAETERFREAVQNSRTGADKNFIPIEALHAGQTALVAGGYGESSANAELTSALTGLRGSTVYTAAAIDKAFSLSDGTAMKAITEFASQSGKSIDEATRQIERLAAVATITGTNFGSLLGVFSQITTQIRFQGVEVNALAGAYDLIAKTGKDFGLGEAGSRKLGMDTLGKFAGGMDGMQDGVKVEVARRISERLGLSGGRELDSYAALNRMDTSFSRFNTDGSTIDKTSQVLQTVVEMAMEKIPGNTESDEGRRSLYYQKALGIDSATSVVLAKLIASTGGDFTKEMTPKQKEQLANVRQNVEDANKNPVVVLLEKINGLLVIGIQGIIQTLVAIAAGIKLGLEIAMNPEYFAQNKGAYMDALSNNFNPAKDSLGNFMKTGSSLDLGPAFKGAFSAGNTTWSLLPQNESFTDQQQRIIDATPYFSRDSMRAVFRSQNARKENTSNVTSMATNLTSQMLEVSLGNAQPTVRFQLSLLGLGSATNNNTAQAEVD